MVLQSRSWIQITDNSGIKKVRIFHIYRSGLKKRGLSGYYYCGSIRKYSQTVNLRRSKKKIRKRQKVHGLIVRCKQYQYKLDGSRLRCWDNAGISLKNVFKMRGSNFVGPICENTRRLRYFSLFKAVV